MLLVVLVLLVGLSQVDIKHSKPSNQHVYLAVAVSGESVDYHKSKSFVYLEKHACISPHAKLS